MKEQVSLSQAMQVKQVAEQRFEYDVPVGWAQGRGAFGGIVLGAMLNAVRGVYPDTSRAVRSVTGNLAAPALVGMCDIEVMPVRVGSGVSVVNALMSQAGQPVATMTVVLGVKRIADRDFQPSAPDFCAAFDELRSAPMKPPMAPEFSQNFDYRTNRYFPYSGGEEAKAEGWFKPHLAISLNEAELVAFADVWWPAGFALEKQPRPIATVGTMTEIFMPQGDIDQLVGQAFYHKAYAHAGRDGYLVEFREIWTEEKELLALNQQTFVWIK